MIRFTWLMILTGLMFAGTGCRNTSNRHSWCREGGASQPLFVPPPSPTILQPQQQGFQSLPPQQQQQAFPTLPPGQQQQAFPTLPPGQQQQAFPTLPPGGQPPPSITPMDPSKSRFEPNWKPTEAREPARDVPPRIQLYAPEPIDRERSSEPPLNGKPSVQATFPSIPQFTSPMENVFAGLRPPVDGFDWLQRNRVATVVNVRLPGEDDSADRKQVESRGMRYLALEVSPMTLSREKADEFIKLIRENAKQGLFIYDRDGSLAGAMWYLQLRWGEFLDDEPAQLRANQLGLQTNREGPHRDMWLAVQKVLSENP